MAIQTVERHLQVAAALTEPQNRTSCG